MAKYRVLIKPWAVYVKEEGYFRQQQGHRSAWGKGWTLIEASSVEDARAKGVKMRGYK